MEVPQRVRNRFLYPLELIRVFNEEVLRCREIEKQFGQPGRYEFEYRQKAEARVDVLPALKDGASTAVFPSPIEGSGSTWVGLVAWASSPARPTPIHPRRERRGLPAFIGKWLFADSSRYRILQVSHGNTPSPSFKHSKRSGNIFRICKTL